MNHSSASFSGYEDATHKPRISFVSDDIGTCYKCADGGLTMYGETPEQAYRELQAIRG